jgi:hypothetical protein
MLLKAKKLKLIGGYQTLVYYDPFSPDHSMMTPSKIHDKYAHMVYFKALFQLMLFLAVNSVWPQGITISDFVQSPTLPVIASGTSGVPPMLMDPFILYDDEGYHLFYSTLFCRKQNGDHYYSWDPKNHRQCDIDQSVSALGYAFSSDKGLTWQFRESAIFMPSSAGWDSSNVETASVVKKNDQLLLFYSGYGEVLGRKLKNRFQIGVSFLDLKGRSLKKAFLSDLDSFNRKGRQAPILSAVYNQSSFFNNIQEPSVIFRNNQFELYFIGIGFSNPDKSAEEAVPIIQFGMGLAKFDEKMNLLSITQNPILTGVNITEVRHFNGGYHLFSASLGSTDNVHEDEHIDHFTSQDGLTWGDSERLLPNTIAGLDDWAQTAPTAIFDKDLQKFVLFYAAFGLQPGVCQPNLRYGYGVNPQSCAYAMLGRALGF